MSARTASSIFGAPNSTRPRVSLRFACLTRPVPGHERSLRYFYFLHISVYPS
jgi:hypothetical protein